VVVAASPAAAGIGERLRHAIDPFARRDLGARGRLEHRLAVLVHSHEKMDLVPAQAAIAGDGVRADLLQRMPQMGIAVGVIDGGGEVEPGHYRRSSSSETMRVVPSPLSARSVTRSRQMSTAITRSLPADVVTVFPSLGKRLRCCT